MTDSDPVSTRRRFVCKAAVILTHAVHMKTCTKRSPLRVSVTNDSSPVCVDNMLPANK